MLVLSRKAQERLRLGTDIEIVVVRINGNRVQLGVTAPSAVRVIRCEPSEREAKDAPIA